MRQLGQRLGRGGVLGLFLVFLGIPSAWGGDVYTVSGLGTTASGSTAALAREAALDKAYVAALEIVWRRMTPAAERRRLPTARAEDARVMALSFAIEREKLARGVYEGSISVQFSPDRVRAGLDQAGVAYADQQRRPVLLVPVWAPPSGLEVWRANPWLAVWRGRDLDNAMAPLVIPVGDLDERVGTPAARVLESTHLSLARRYGLETALVVVARPVGSRAVAIEVVARRGEDESHAAFFVEEASLSASLARAADLTMEMLAQGWRARLASRAGEEVALRDVHIIYENFAQWRAIADALDTAPALRSWRTRSLTSRWARADLLAVGSTRSLGFALADRGVRLEQTAAGGWRLSRPEVPVAGGG